MKMNKKGFTLMEMLIVIAIIAILIAIAIPTFTSALEKSRQRTDMANVRSLKSLAVADYMSEGGVIPVDEKGEHTCYLLKGGQAFTLDGTDLSKIIVCEAKWATKDPDADEDYTTGDPVYVVINTAANGAIVKTVPYIPGNASSFED